jgi:hypothetical protein
MRQINVPPPNLWHSRGRYRGLSSKDWVPRSAVQRFGAFIIGTVFVAGGLMMIWMSFGFRREFQAEISSPPIALMVSLLAVMMALVVASFVIWLGGRLLAGCFRHSPIRNVRT